jgi:hypothetical protein
LVTPGIRPLPLYLPRCYFALSVIDDPGIPIFSIVKSIAGYGNDPSCNVISIDAIQSFHKIILSWNSQNQNFHC